MLPEVSIEVNSGKKATMLLPEIEKPRTPSASTLVIEFEPVVTVTERSSPASRDADKSALKLTSLKTTEAEVGAAIVEDAASLIE